MEDRAGGTHPGPSRIAKNPLPDKGPGERGLRACLKSIETPSQGIFFRRCCVGLT